MDTSARQTTTLTKIRDCGAGRFVGNVMRRFQRADGTSHSRSLAYQSILVLLPAFIGAVGLASLLDARQLRGVVQELALRISPGPSGEVLREAAAQGAAGGATATFLGLAAAVTAATFAMTQVERSANRIFGADRDRPTAQRYLVGFLLAVSSGVLMAAGAIVLAAGDAVTTGAGWSGGAASAWAVVRWPLGIVVIAAAIYLLFRVAPRVRPASNRELGTGVLVAVVLWVAFTLLLALYFAVAGTTARTYGPLLSIIALVVWCGLTSLALHLGLAVSAELSNAGPAERSVSIPESPAVVARV
jgi:YihY family inner membrane protein